MPNYPSSVLNEKLPPDILKGFCQERIATIINTVDYEESSAAELNNKEFKSNDDKVLVETETEVFPEIIAEHWLRFFAQEANATELSDLDPVKR